MLGHVAGFGLTNSAEAALEGADALLIVTEWREFRTSDFDHIKATLKQPLVLDGRNLYESNLMRSLSIDYVGIVRGVRAVHECVVFRQERSEVVVYAIRPDQKRPGRTGSRGGRGHGEDGVTGRTGSGL